MGAPTPLPTTVHALSFLSREKFSIFVPSSTRVDLRVHTIHLAILRSFFSQEIIPLEGARTRELELRSYEVQRLDHPGQTLELDPHMHFLRKPCTDAPLSHQTIARHSALRSCHPLPACAHRYCGTQAGSAIPWGPEAVEQTPLPVPIKVQPKVRPEGGWVPKRALAGDIGQPQDTAFT